MRSSHVDGSLHDSWGGGGDFRKRPSLAALTDEVTPRPKTERERTDGFKIAKCSAAACVRPCARVVLAHAVTQCTHALLATLPLKLQQESESISWLGWKCCTFRLRQAKPIHDQ